MKAIGFFTVTFWILVAVACVTFLVGRARADQPSPSPTPKVCIIRTPDDPHRSKGLTVDGDKLKDCDSIEIKTGDVGYEASPKPH